jgi:thiol:disulfide interchange protein DsbG
MRIRDGKAPVVKGIWTAALALASCFLTSAESRGETSVNPGHSMAWSEFAKTTYVVSGMREHPKSVIYAFFDPNCGYCHFLWLALRPYEAAGLQVRWVPVGILGEDSLIKAAAVIDGGDPVLTELQENFEGRFQMRFGVTGALKTQLDDNLELMHAAQVHGTPGIFYKDSAGHVMKCSGMPKLRALPAITGLPIQPEPDPRLNRFR